MTIPVPLHELCDRAASFGRYAYVITSSGLSAPRVTFVEVQVRGTKGEATTIQTRLGNSACRELVENKNVTVLWPSREKEEGGLCLIVDGVLRQEPPQGGGELVIQAHSGILHQSRSL